MNLTTSPLASDPAQNPYWKRDVRRAYPQLSVVTQSELSTLLLDHAQAQQVYVPSAYYNIVPLTSLPFHMLVLLLPWKARRLRPRLFLRNNNRAGLTSPKQSLQSLLLARHTRRANSRLRLPLRSSSGDQNASKMLLTTLMRTSR